MQGIDGGLEAARNADDDLAAQQLDAAARSLTHRREHAHQLVRVAGPLAARSSAPTSGRSGTLSAQASDVAEVSSLAAASADVDTLRFTDGRLDPQAVADLEEPLRRVADAARRRPTTRCVDARRRGCSAS